MTNNTALFLLRPGLIDLYVVGVNLGENSLDVSIVRWH